MSIIELSRHELSKAQEKLFDIDKLNIGILEKFIAKIMPREVSSMIIWSEILSFSCCWVVKAEVIEELVKNFDEEKLVMVKRIDLFTLADAFYLCKPFN